MISAAALSDVVAGPTPNTENRRTPAGKLISLPEGPSPGYIFGIEIPTLSPELELFAGEAVAASRPEVMKRPDFPHKQANRERTFGRV